MIKRYIGKLQSGKQFDANTSGAPFTFRLGAGEVIKGEFLLLPLGFVGAVQEADGIVTGFIGWDVGVAGMKVGGERKLTVSAPFPFLPRWP